MEPPLKKRILLILLVVAIQSIYTPTSLLLEGGIEPKLPIDVFPLWVIWVIPYVLCYPLWIFALIWLVWKMEEHLFRATLAGLLFTCSLGISIFILFPTYVVPPEITGTDILSRLLRFLQVAGGDHDAFPSAHIYITVILAFFYNEWYPRGKWIWLLIVIIVALSTLFTRQHYILDVVGGIVVAWMGYNFGLWWQKTGFKRWNILHNNT